MGMKTNKRHSGDLHAPESEMTSDHSIRTNEDVVYLCERVRQRKWVSLTFEISVLGLGLLLWAVFALWILAILQTEQQRISIQ